MKKFLALTLSLLMMFSIIPMATFVSADETTYTKVLDFDNNMTSVTLSAANANSVTGGVINYAEVDDSYTDGNVLKMDAVQWTNFGFSIGNVLKGKKVKSISYTVWSDSSQSWLPSRTGIGNSGFSSLVLTGSGSFGYSSNIGITSTPKTITYDFSKTAPSAYNTISNAYMVFANNSNNVAVYIDNIVITYQKYAGTFTGGAEGDKIVYADENGKLLAPNTTVTNGEFVGWVTEDDVDNIITANTEITITEDTTYIAVSTARESQAAPEAPVVESKTANSVTLVANDIYQYSKDGETWQNSNVFSDLSGGTEYTFYQRLKATPTKLASPASEGTTVKTNAVYKWNLYSDYFTIKDGATLKPYPNASSLFYDNWASDGTYFVSMNNTIGTTATLTSLLTVEPGVYSAKLYARTGAPRASIDVLVNETKVASSLNTYIYNGGNNVPFELNENTVIVSKETTIDLTFTITAIGNSAGRLFLNALELTKIADFENAGTTTTAVSTDAKASIRLNDKAGIRFYTKFDVSQIEGTIVEKGTLIGPADLVGDYLTFEDEKVGNAVAVPYLADTLWDNNEFVGSIVGIQEKNYNRAFTARAYVKLEDGTYLYSSASTTKTVAEIADAYIADANSGYADLDTETKKLVDAWAAAND